VGAILMIVLTIVVLAAAVADSRDRVRRDVLTDDASLRAWYEARYARRGLELNRDNLVHALQRAKNMRRWGPVALSGGTMLAVLTLMSVAASTVPGIESVWFSPQQLLEFFPAEVLVQATIVLVLIPVLIVEGILAALFVAEFDIGRLQRLLDSLD
jgi:hypothetical protein